MSKEINLKKIVLLMFVFITLLAIAGGYWLYSSWYVSTDDAYINANVVQVSARVTGLVVKVDVTHNQFVHKGQVLFQLDQTPFIVAVKKAQAQLSMDQATLADAKVSADRITRLAQKNDIALQARDNAVAKLKATAAQVALDKANLENAKLNLQYTTVKSPISAYVSHLSLRPHDTVNANDPQFALVASKGFWVDANFKETAVDKIKIGAKAEIHVDMYPGHVFIGKVQSISRGSGNAFALLPAQNATGNWVKVTQRVPVKIAINHPDSNYPLRIGTSATVTIPVVK